MPSVLDPAYLLVEMVLLLLVRCAGRSWPVWFWPLALVFFPLVVAWAVETHPGEQP